MKYGLRSNNIDYKLIKPKPNLMKKYYSAASVWNERPRTCIKRKNIKIGQFKPFMPKICCTTTVNDISSTSEKTSSTKKKVKAILRDYHKTSN